MDEQIIERAVEAAARADYEALYSSTPGRRKPWDERPEEVRDGLRCYVRPIVTAALAEVEASLTAERDRLARRIDTLLGVADEDDITYSPKELQRARSRYAAFEYDNLAAERDDLAASVARVEALHRPITRTHYHATVTECSLCIGRAYPCPTIKAVRGESE